MVSISPLVVSVGGEGEWRDTKLLVVNTATYIVFFSSFLQQGLTAVVTLGTTASLAATVKTVVLAGWGKSASQQSHGSKVVNRDAEERIHLHQFQQ
jgi:hypothetical protein